MSVQIFKFGGASVKDAAGVRNLAQIVADHHPRLRLLIVVSAMGKTTNALEKLYALATGNDPEACDAAFASVQRYHQEIAETLFEPSHEVFALLDNLFAKLRAKLSDYADGQRPDEGYDQVVSFGEVLSSHVVAHYLHATGLPTRWLDARRFVQTDTTWREAQVDWSWTERRAQREIKPALESEIAITQGFLGGTVDGRTTTLGREGSDFTAAVYAAALDADLVTIWKDVPGVLSADPKRLPDAVLLPRLSYQEAAEMTYYGATVIHPKTIRPLAAKNIELSVRSFLKPEASGTLIGTHLPEHLPPAIIFKPDQQLIVCTATNFTFMSGAHVQQVLEAMARLNVQINLMQSGAVSLGVGTDNVPRKVGRLVEALQNTFELHLRDDLELITVKRPTPTVVADILDGRAPVLMQQTADVYRALVSTA